MSKEIIKRISAVVLALVAIICMIVSESTGLTITDTTCVTDLIKATRKDDWYDFKPSNVIGKKINVAATNDLPGGYCVDPENSLLDKGNKYEIVNTFDINNGENKVVVYSIENPKGTEYELSDEKVKPLLMIAYIAMKADENPDYHPTWGYKDTLNRIFNTASWIKKLRKIGLSASFQSCMYDDSYLSAPAVQEKLKAAEKYADKMQKNGPIEEAVLKLSMTKEEKENVSMIVDGGKTYIGPYKVSKSKSCTVGEITVKTDNGEVKASGISTDLKKVVSVEKVADEKEFYVVVDDELEKVSSINVKAKEAIATLKSRMVLVGNSPSQNFLIWKSEETYVQPEVQLPIPTSGKLQILKKDEFNDSNLNLKNIGFMVWSVNKKAYIIVNSKGKIEYVDFETAKKNEFKTNKKGETEVINNLPVGKYKIYETSLPDNLKQYYELPDKTLNDGKGGKVKTKAKLVKVDDKDYVVIKSGQLVPVTAVNHRDFTTLKVQKIDEDTGLPLEGIEFKLFSEVKGKEGWVTTNSKNEVTGTTLKFDEAASFVTQNDGWTAKITTVPVGTYLLYETGLGDYEDIYEELKPIRIYGGNTGGMGLLKGTIDVVANKDNEFSFTAKNKQKYIAISGNVWEDIPTFDANKNKNEINNTYEEDVDYKIDGIEVRLMDKTTKAIVKDENGKELKTKTSNGGKYKFEKVEIDNLANYYVEFTYDGVTYQNVVTPSNVTDTTKTSKAKESDRQGFNDIFTEITGEGQVLNGVTLTYTKTDDRVYSNNIAQKTSDKAKKLVSISKPGDFLIKSVTADKYLSTAYNKLKEANSKKIVKEIKDVNLGVYERTQSVISVAKDVHSTKLSVNGFNHIYTYGAKSEEYNTKRAEDFNVGVKWKKNLVLEGFDPYKTPVYRSDYEYESDDKSKELKVSIIYKIQLVNDSATNSRVTRVNSVVDYFDKRYENIEVGTGLDESTGTIKGNLEYKMDSTYSNDTYAKAIIYTNMDIERGLEGNSKELYVKFDLSKENVGLLLENGELLDNTVEVNSYTIKDGDKLYASFDIYSIPANADPKKPEEFENDTDKAPGLMLAPQDDRTMSGVVFEDNAISEGTGKERIGNGQYDEGETTISGVKVKLVETDRDGNVKANGRTYDAATETVEDGTFSISGYIPGYYKLIYTWGEDSEDGYNVKDYKGTIYVDRDTSKMDWYKQDNRYSDAMDDYKLRIAIDNNDTSTYSDLSKMNSTTKVFGIGIEYSGENPGENITTITTGDSFVRCDVSTMDFGIIERPRQSMSIDKHVSTLKVSTTAKQTLVDAVVNSEGKLEGKYDDVVKGVTGGIDLGYFKVEMDNDIIQDSTAEVGYEIKVTNTSEVDYDSEAYYLYGRKEGNIITIQATGIYDYLKGSNSDAAKNDTMWSIVPVDATQTMELSKIEGKTVIDYVADRLTKELKPGEPVSENIYATKPLANTGDISLENDTEIKGMESGGTTHTSTNPTNPSDPSNSAESTEGTNNDTVTRKFKTGREPQARFSTLFATAEPVTITPPTGENRDYTAVIIISIAAITILGTGIIVIKKKVLNK